MKTSVTGVESAGFLVTLCAILFGDEIYQNFTDYLWTVNYFKNHQRHFRSCDIIAQACFFSDVLLCRCRTFLLDCYVSGFLQCGG